MSHKSSYCNVMNASITSFYMFIITDNVNMTIVNENVIITLGVLPFISSLNNVLMTTLLGFVELIGK